MTKLTFYYSSVYDRSIASWLGKKWRDEYVEKGSKYTRKVQKKWDKINDKVFAAFESFGFRLPKFWLAYPITGWTKTIAFSSPLTFRISYDWEHVFITLIHELAHVELAFKENEKLSNKIYGYIEEIFAKENRVTIIHIPVNLLQLAVMAKIFPRKYKKMLVRQKSLPGLKRAWKIIEENKENINLSDPINSILRLKAKS